VVGLNCPSQIIACTQFGPGCGGGTLPPPITVPLACQPTFPAPCPTQVCTHVGPACPTHQVACTIGGPACGITIPNNCPIQSAVCPTLACPTHHVVACTIGGPACGITIHCPIQSAACATVSPPCPVLTHNQPICHPSLITPCPTAHAIQCVPSVAH